MNDKLDIEAARWIIRQPYVRCERGSGVAEQALDELEAANKRIAKLEAQKAAMLHPIPMGDPLPPDAPRSDL